MSHVFSIATHAIVPAPVLVATSLIIIGHLITVLQDVFLLMAISKAMSQSVQSVIKNVPSVVLSLNAQLARNGTSTTLQRSFVTLVLLTATLVIQVETVSAAMLQLTFGS